MCVCERALLVVLRFPASPNREHLSNSSHRPKCSPLSRPHRRPRPRTKSNHSPNQKQLEQSEDKIQNTPKVTPQDDPTQMCATGPRLANVPSAVPYGSPTIIHPRNTSGVGDEHRSPTSLPLCPLRGCVATMAAAAATMGDDGRVGGNASSRAGADLAARWRGLGRGRRQAPGACGRLRSRSFRRRQQRGVAWCVLGRRGNAGGGIGARAWRWSAAHVARWGPIVVSVASPARASGRAGEPRCHALSLPSERRAVRRPRVARPATRRPFPLPSGRPLRRGEWGGVAGGVDGPRRWGKWRRRRLLWLATQPQPTLAIQ